MVFRIKSHPRKMNNKNSIRKITGKYYHETCLDTLDKTVEVSWRQAHPFPCSRCGRPLLTRWQEWLNWFSWEHKDSRQEIYKEPRNWGKEIYDLLQAMFPPNTRKWWLLGALIITAGFLIDHFYRDGASMELYKWTICVLGFFGLRDIFTLRNKYKKTNNEWPVLLLIYSALFFVPLLAVVYDWGNKAGQHVGYIEAQGECVESPRRFIIQARRDVRKAEREREADEEAHSY